MSYTKRQFILAALEEIGITNYDFDIAPEQMQSHLRRLDTMIASWNGMGIRLGYPLPSNPDDSELDDITGVPDSANEAIICGLALKLAPSYGKQAIPATMDAANRAFNVLLSRAAAPIEKQLPGSMPRGAGYKSEDPFLEEPSIPVNVGPDGQLELY